MMTRTLMTTLLLAFLAGGIASAGISSQSVIAAFRGQLVISKAELSEGKNDKETIAKIKTEKLAELKGEAKSDVQQWNFYYTAFITKTGNTTLKMEFWRDGKQYSADKRLDGIDPKSAVLTGSITIDEDEGLAKGKSYVIKLVGPGDSVVASTTLLMK
jgi:hypothetical protein